MTNDLKSLSKLIRRTILTSTTEAGSGHPTSSLSATDIMTVLWFGRSASSARLAEASSKRADTFFHFDFNDADNSANDRMIFSKGHASPLYYALYQAAGVISDKEVMTLRKFSSRLEGHPTPRFPFTEAATGSLGQGLSVGVGMALAQKRGQGTRIRDQGSEVSNQKLTPGPSVLTPKTYVLLGDSELAEGSVWEAAEIASYYKLNNLVAIADINRLGQSGETMLGWNVEIYQKRFEAFGWETVVIDGHDFKQISFALEAQRSKLKGQNEGKPFVIIAKTIKGKGVSFLENKEGWHGKAVPKDQLESALKELGNVDLTIRGVVDKPALSVPTLNSPKSLKELKSDYKKGDSIATRKAYGDALAKLGEYYPNIVALDAEVKNSSYAEIFKNKFPERFFEMFIAEQNMVGVAGGLAKRGFIPFVSTFACFLTRGFDQIRMAALSEFNIKFVGSHAGVSIGEDGPSQMALEDLAMFRAIFGSTIFYPADAVATEKVLHEMIKKNGIFYLRTTRANTPVIYGNGEKFFVGGSKIHRINNKKPALPAGRQITNNKKTILVVTAGITLYEALKAQEELSKNNIEIIVLDAYCIKPIDKITLSSLADQVEAIITVEDHWIEGGLGDAVLEALSDKKIPIYKLAVTKMPRSGKPAELLAYEEIDAEAIVKKVTFLV